ncbi:phosphoglycerate kinase [Dethiobacter alkaliphilus]|uniref:Phosphoglycerate kinase n=1 Tax=Dethiobacter alkaliphilus AHT 1 TaxID=555088 RepID=C0GFB3_DETAL|nr:phosphoglycerate kinase [Dethiobacter alkaliphilus]EEG77873.1 Phosphoglycerate kinase [Dethiobacter alkaliphilus AHT 1]
MTKKSIKDIKLSGMRAFTRVDFNVPRKEDGTITDDTKIRAALPTIRYLLEQGAAVILASHLGRPKGKVNEALRLDSVAQKLSDLLEMEVTKTSEVVGEEVTRAAGELKPGSVLLLENVRFHPGEEKNDSELAKAYAELADVFVSDAFGTAHRAHASNSGVAQYIPAVAGLLMITEIENLTKSLHSPTRPVVAIVGGSKIADKIGVLNTFLKTADSLLLGGGMANTFLRAKDHNMGRSLLEEDKLADAAEIMREAANHDVNLCLPVDFIVADKVDEAAQAETVTVESVPADKMALDIGPQTRKIYKDLISKAGTVIWNGPIGVFEIDKFAEGTIDVARAIAESEAFSIIGGGDVVAAVEKAGVAQDISHLSTGGGATLEFWEGKELPGIAVLQDK